jgi:hypothetical protein
MISLPSLGISITNTGKGEITPPSTDWILENGTWNDSAVWIDDSLWEDS